MKLLDILQGKWLGHPVHAAVVHLPLAAWLLAGVLDVIIVCHAGSAALPYLAYYSAIIGVIGALIAAPAGVADWISIKPGKPAWKLGLAHMILNLVVTLLWVVDLWLRHGIVDTAEPVTPTIATLSVAATIILLVSAYLGSLLTFANGTAVARVSKKYWRQIAVRSGANVPEEK